MNVDGYVSSGGLGGPAILPLSLAKMAQLTQAFPDKAFSGHRRHRRVRARAELLPARLRHGAGVHGGDARSRDRAERDQAAASPGMAAAMERHGWTIARGLPRPAPRSRRRALEDPAARREGLSRRLRRRRLRRRRRAAARPDARRMTRQRSARTSSSSPRTSRAARSGTPISRRRRRRGAPGPPITSPRSGSA